MKHLLQEASNTEQKHEAKVKELEQGLIERNLQVEEMTAQLHQIEEQIANGTLAPQQPQRTKTELEEWNDELEKENARITNERKQLDNDLKQLRDDEEALEKQMRTMEVSMAKERAMLARQETELRRLHAEIQHELEIMNRGDAALREQMQKFQRRAQDVMQKPGGQPQSGPQGWARR
jgi:chromosome segregation ATPase